MEPGAWKDLTQDLDFASGLCCVLGVLGASVCGFVQLSSQKKAVQFLVAGAAALSRVHATFRSAASQCCH
jgi:hypothetical protein